MFRAPTEPVELGGYLFAPGTQIAAAILLVQLDPSLYPPDPQAFRPDRFLEGAPEPYTLIPFGGGVRRCLGAAFATLEMKVVVATILSRTRCEPRARRARRLASAARRCCPAAVARRSSSESPPERPPSG